MLPGNHRSFHQSHILAIPDALGRPNLTDVRYNETATYYWRFDEVLDPVDCYRGENLTSEYFINNPDLLDPSATPICRYPNYGTGGSFFNLWDDGGGQGETGGRDPAGSAGTAVNETRYGKAGRGLVYDADLGICTFLGNFSWAEHQCMVDPNSCSLGFSIALWVNMTWEDFSAGTTVNTFMSTAPETDRAGFRIYQDGFYTRAEVRNQTQVWKVGAYRQLSWNNWTNIGVRWSQEMGLMLHINGLEAAMDYVGEEMNLAYAINSSDHLLMGCRVIPNVSNPQDFMVDHANAMVDELAMWRWRLRDEERPFFAGGHIPRPKPLYQPPQAQTTETPTTEAPDMGAFDYLTGLVEVRTPGNEESNPFYTKASGRYWPLNQAALASIDGLEKFGVASYTQSARDDKGWYWYTSSEKAYAKLGTYSGSCHGDLALCGEGLSVSTWIQIPAETSPGMGVILLSGTQTKGFTIYNTSTHLEVAVAFGGNVQTVSIPSGVILPARWTNLAFSWHPDHEAHPLTVFLDGDVAEGTNANLVVGSDLSSVFSLCGNSPGAFWLGCKPTGSTKASYESLSIDDIVAWKRYLNSFEGHHFLGMTYYEKAMLKTTDLLWSVDQFMHRDMKSSALRHFNPLYVTTGTDALWVDGHDGKGKALRLQPTPRGWAVIGESREMQGSPLIGYFFDESSCLSDPALCTQGISLSMWIKFYSLYAVNKTESRAYILSTGEHDRKSVGISVYLFEGKFGVAITNGTKYWKVILANPMKLETWTQVGFTWSREKGLWVFVNGRLDSINLEPITELREKNLLNRVTLGRANDETGFEMRTDFAFEDIGIVFDYLIPAEYRRRFGLIENLQYGSAAYTWSRDQLVTGHLELLDSAHGPVGKYAISEKAVELSHQGGMTAEDSYVDLGSPEMCPHRTSNCNNGLALSVWMRTHHPEVNHYLFRTSLAENSNGIQIELKGGKIAVTFTYDDTGMGTGKQWQCTTSTTVPQSQWINIGLTFGTVSGLKVYFGGRLDCEDTATSMVPAAAAPVSQLVFGVTQADNVTGNAYRWEVASVTLWDKEMLQGHLGKLLGTTEYSRDLYSINDYFWPFEEPMTSMLSPDKATEHTVPQDEYTAVAEAESKPINDKIEHGTAWVTQAFYKVYLSLGDFSNECITNPSLCTNRLALGIWLQLHKNQDGFIFSSGAQQEGSTGVLIRQYMSNNLQVLVANGEKVWGGEITWINIPYDSWLHLRLVWEASTGIKVYINNMLQSTFADGTASVRQPLNTEVTLGKSNSADSGYLSASFDDVSIGYDQHDMMVIQAGCYQTATIVYTLSRLEVPVWQIGLDNINDRYENTGSALRVLSTVLDLGTILNSATCPANPAACYEGLTVSVWMKIPSWVQFEEEVYIVSYGYPNVAGFAIRIGHPSSTVEPVAPTTSAPEASNTTEAPSPGSPSNSGSSSGSSSAPLRLVCTVHNGQDEYEVSAPIPELDTWLNIALAWSTIDARGISMYTDGNHTATSSLPLASSNTMAPWDSHLFLGGHSVTGTSVPGMELDDLAIWTKDVTTQADYEKKLIGDTCPPSIVDPFMFFDSIYKIPVVVDTCVLRLNLTCVENIASLYQFLRSAEVDDVQVFDAVAVSTALEILYNKTLPKGAGEALSDNVLYKTADAYINICKAMVRIYTETISEQKCQQEIDRLVSILANLLYPVMYKASWKSIHKIHAGLPAMVQQFEEVALHLMKLTDMVTDELQFDLHYSSVYIMVKRFVYTTITPGFTFPEMNYDTMNDTIGSWRDELDQLRFSHALLKEATANTPNTTVIIVAGIFDTLHELFPTELPVHLVLHDAFPTYGKINSRIVTSKMSPAPEEGWFRTNNTGVKITYEIHKEPVADKEVPYCMFWDPTMQNPHSERATPGAWTDVGCKAQSVAADTTTDTTHTVICDCTHMTTYAMVVKSIPDAEPDPHEMPIKIITYIGIIISMVTLTVFAFKVFGLKQKQRDIPLILRNLTIALIFLHLVVAIAESAGGERPTLCQGMSILLHYLYCVTFCWLLMETVDLMYTITTAVMTGRGKYYVLAAWGVPLLPVIGMGVVSLDSYGVQPHCWIAYDGVYHLALFGPALAFIFFALLASLINLCNITTPALKDETIFRHVRLAIRNNVILMPILMLAWLFGYFALSHSREVWLQYLTAIFYSFQGFFIVMAHSISNPYFYVTREIYEGKKEEESEDEEEKVSSRPSTARPETARPKTGKVGPILVYKP